MIMTTTPDLPGAKFVPLGIVHVTRRSAFKGMVDFAEALRALSEEAVKLGGQGLVGVQVSSAPWGNNVVTTLVGTAVRFVPGAEAGVTA